MTQSSNIDRRSFLKLSAGTLSAAALASLPLSIRQALAIPPATVTGTIQDVQHIVVLMQENRSFDHYFGTLSGIRGFGDPRPIKLSTGQSVWYQPSGTGTTVTPFRPDVADLGSTFVEDLDHSWAGTHKAWNNGKLDQWVPAKGQATMVHMNRSDIPFHFQLADAFTICDAYHCSTMTQTDPNRYYMWTGWLGNDGVGGGPVLNNAEVGYDWGTYPELLEKNGVSWKIYQDIGDGLDANGNWGWTDANKPFGQYQSGAYIGNYGDNALLYFHQYQNAQPGNPLYDKARTGTNILKSGTLFDQLKQDVANNTLPQVSWIAAPEAYSEHPNWPANYGAWYIDQVLETLTSNPDVWSKTVLLITYDENDGFFDHMAAPYPSNQPGQSTVSTENEFFAGNAKFAAGPYGLGPRVPMLVLSPWSTGGWVNSQVFDHTSIIQFIEKRFGVKSPNITPWRRAICGDLTSTLDFTKSNSAIPSLMSTAKYVPADTATHPDYVPVPPTQSAVPVQEKGQRPARAVPYELFAHATNTNGTVSLDFTNTGGVGAVFYVQSSQFANGPWSFTVGAGSCLTYAWAPSTSGQYDLSVYGPNGFFRTFAGTTNPLPAANVETQVCYDIANGNIQLTLINHGTAASQVQVADGSYGAQARSYSIAAGAQAVDTWSLANSNGWYDLLVTVAADNQYLRHIAGHVETGNASMTDPAIKTA